MILYTLLSQIHSDVSLDELIDVYCRLPRPFYYRDEKELIRFSDCDLSPILSGPEKQRLVRGLYLHYSPLGIDTLPVEEFTAYVVHRLKPYYLNERLEQVLTSILMTYEYGQKRDLVEILLVTINRYNVLTHFHFRLHRLIEDIHRPIADSKALAVL